MAFFSQVSYTDKIYEIFIEKLSIPIGSNRNEDALESITLTYLAAASCHPKLSTIVTCLCYRRYDTLSEA